MPPAASLATSLKRGEGEPLSRHDVQYALLEKIFGDERAVFTPGPESVHAKKGHLLSFGDLYIDDFMASLKLSKTLKEKFLNDPKVTRKVCMASLLVNIGRINTTLVFTPTQARTYNPIPSIQAYGSGHKMLQDAPRLKGILKGSCEKSITDWETLRSLQDSDAPKPLTNPINLVFLLSSSATILDKVHFQDDAFMAHELLSDPSFTSDSRANAFLWLMYFYLESNGTSEAARENPFGSGGDFLTPPLVHATEAEILSENVDLPPEIAYSTRMWEERKRYLALTAQKASESSAFAAQPPRETPRQQARKLEKEKEESRASTPDETVRRSSRKVKRKTYDSGPDSEDLLVPEESYRSLRAAQILRHKLQRSQHASRRARRVESAIQRAYRLGGQGDSFEWDDDDGEEAKTIARLIRRAERRGRRMVDLDGQKIGDDRRKSTGGFKIKLKF